MYQRKKRRPVAEINVVPYIDVMLVLLIILMATAATITHGVDVELPKKLVTTYEKEIEFKQEMTGTADIITEDLRLIERFFYLLLFIRFILRGTT